MSCASSMLRRWATIACLLVNIIGQVVIEWLDTIVDKDEKLTRWFYKLVGQLGTTQHIVNKSNARFEYNKLLVTKDNSEPK